MDHGPKKLLRHSFLISFSLHAFLVTSLWFFLRSDSVERALGDSGGEVIYISLGKAIPAQAGIQKNPLDPRFRGDDGNVNQPHLFEQGEGGENGSSDILRQIKIKIERAKFYPLIAKRTHLEGAPEVELKIKQNGSLEYIALKKSCGSKILDDAALSTVKLAAPFPFYPEPIALNIEYSLTR